MDHLTARVNNCPACDSSDIDELMGLGCCNDCFTTFHLDTSEMDDTNHDNDWPDWLNQDDEDETL